MILLLFTYGLITAFFILDQKIGASISLILMILSITFTELEPALIGFTFFLTQLATEAIVRFIPAYKNTFQDKGLSGWLLRGGTLHKWIGWIPTLMILGFGLIVSLTEYLT